MEVGFAGAGAAPDPSKAFAVPKPTKSITCVPAGLVPLCATVVFTSKTFPAVPERANVPVASGVGKLSVPPAPCASCIR
ncbi:hypothetical protein D3C72_1832860 [compost metagenome]